MREVAIIGLGQTPVGEHWDTSLRTLASDAARAALDDAGLTSVDALYVGNAYGATFSSQSQIGALAADYAGLHGVEAFAVDAGEASGGAALRAGYLAVASGAVDRVMVLGVEKASDTVGTAHNLARNVSLDADYEFDSRARRCRRWPRWSCAAICTHTASNWQPSSRSASTRTPMAS